MMPSVEVDDGGDGSVVYPGEASEGHPWDVGGVSTWGRWTLEEWENWYQGRHRRWDTAMTGTSTTTPTGDLVGSHSDPWWEHQGDPWTQPRRDEDRGGGGADKIPVPEFSGEEDKDGMLTRGYLRKVEAWRRVSRLKPAKQALMLYNHLSGKAWRDAEELELSQLDREDGVDYFKKWIEHKYLEKEVVKVARTMSEFFKAFKKTSGQEIRDFNQQFDLHIGRLREIGCQLPEICVAWWYVDKLRLDNHAELNLLSSTNNDYNLEKLQEAAQIQDRMNRRMWEHPSKRDQGHGGKRQGYQALITDALDDAEDQEITDGDVTDEANDEEAEDDEAHEAYVAFQNAKSKYQNVLRARGTTGGGNGQSDRAKEERIKLAKARSFCSACKKKGHWHRDPECPLNANRDKVRNPQVAHLCEIYLANHGGHQDYYMAILDCACSRTLAGRPWLATFVKSCKTKGIEIRSIPQDEVFKFGGEKLYPSSVAWLLWLNLRGHWVLVKVSEVEADVPLLLSRAVLAKLGMKFDLRKNAARFDGLGLSDIALEQTRSGHPALPILDGGSEVPSWPVNFDWPAEEIYIPSAHRVYIAEGVRPGLGEKGKGKNLLFYPKKLDQHVVENLVKSSMCEEWFRGWWHSTSISRDFWIEGEEYMDRIHVTPRRDFFTPCSWNTPLTHLKKQLLEMVGDVRVSFCIPCLRAGPGFQLEHEWQIENNELNGKLLWIGRSRFKKVREPDQIRSLPPRDSQLVDASLTMGDAEGRAAGRAGQSGCDRQGEVDRPGTSLTLHRDEGPHREGHGAYQADLGAVEGEVPPRRSGVPGEGDPWRFDEAASREQGAGRGLPRDLREVSVLQVRGGPGGVPGLGTGRVEEGREHASPDLERLARWVEDQIARGLRGSPKPVAKSKAAGYRQRSLPSAPASSQLPVHPTVAPELKNKIKENQLTRKSEAMESGMESDYTMVTDRPSTAEEISELEERLKILRKVAEAEEQNKKREEAKGLEGN